VTPVAEPRAASLWRDTRARVALGIGGCVALAAASLLVPAALTYDPWSWMVFGREIVAPEPGFSTISRTGWKPLAVVFTAPLTLLGGVAPSLWLVLVRTVGLAAMALAFRLAARAAGPIAGALAVVLLVVSSDWLRYLSAGNIEPVIVALALGAVELHLSGRRGWAFTLGALSGLARPEVWALVGLYALYLWWRDGSRWPLLLGVPAMLGLWIVPDWIGSGVFLHIFHQASSSAEPSELQAAGDPGVGLLKGAAAYAPAPVWILAPCAAVLGWRARDRTVLALTAVVLAWAGLTIVATAAGYPAVPRYLVGPVALCCVLAGIGAVTVVRALAPGWPRIAVAAVLVAVAIPFAIDRADGLGQQVTAAQVRSEAGDQLQAAVDRARQRAPVARLRPAIEPGGFATGLAWRLRLPLNGVRESVTPASRVAFIRGDPARVVADLRRRGATTEPLARAGLWHVVRIRPG
jgi:hypothetical protein